MRVITPGGIKGSVLTTTIKATTKSISVRLENGRIVSYTITKES